MRSIDRRIKDIEDKVNMGKQSLFVVIKQVDSEQLPEPTEEWITYKEARANCGPLGVFVADPSKELEARQNLRKAALTEPAPEDQI